MKTCTAILLALCAAFTLLHSQTPKEVSVLLEARPQSSPAYHILLTWNDDPKSTGYEIGRKERSWVQFNTLASLPKIQTSYIDTSAQEGVAYEYAIISTIVKDTTYGYGYAYSGTKVAAEPIRGAILVLVDSLMLPSLSSEVQRLKQDLDNEGWLVQSMAVPRTENFNRKAVDHVKLVVREWYDQLDGKPATLLLLGRVAVPYSGMIYRGNIFPGPDAHPEHSGAWAADTYYGCMSVSDDEWTDLYDNTRGAYPDNKNLAGDGRFDNLEIPGTMDVRIGRVDMYNMGLFYKLTKKVDTSTVIDSLASERELLRAYLNKDHNFRTGQVKTNGRGLVDDNFGAYGEAFARSGWMAYAALLGRNNIDEKDWLTALSTESYTWAYGCGGGTFESAGGVGTSTMFAAQKNNAVFTMLFGSYFGDWDKANNFLRAPLATEPNVLTCCWAGRPFWHFHTMALGESIGDATLLSENNTGPYVEGYYSHGVHMALMGDPTLRMDYGKVPEPQGLSVTQIWVPESSIELRWHPPTSTSEIRGYYIYKQHDGGQLEVLNGSAVTSDTIFHDKQLFEGNVRYVVRSVGLLQSLSGSFYDISPPAQQSLRVTSVTDNLDATPVTAHPNPARNVIHFDFSLASVATVDIAIYTLRGERIATLASATLAPGEQHLAWNLGSNDGRVAEGVYILRANIGNTTQALKFCVID